MIHSRLCLSDEWVYSVLTLQNQFLKCFNPVAKNEMKQSSTMSGTMVTNTPSSGLVHLVIRLKGHMQVALSRDLSVNVTAVTVPLYVNQIYKARRESHKP